MASEGIQTHFILQLYAALHQSGLYGRVVREKTLLSLEFVVACWEFTKLYLKDHESTRKNIHWDEVSGSGPYVCEMWVFDL